MSKKIILALGGNALGKTCQEQASIVKSTAVAIVDLVEEGYDILLSHGNGPQVGLIKKAFDESATEMPFPECGAMSQGYIGYHLQNAIQNELRSRGINKSIASVITRTVVKSDDPAFANPTKPIGSFLTKEEAEHEAAIHPDQCFMEDAGRGYRQVVPSPMPSDFVEKDLIKTLIDGGHMVIASGGGGIPVIEKDGHYCGVDAVIDKDHASALLGQLVGAEGLLILTTVEKVAINFGQPNQQGLGRVTCQEMRDYSAQGMFAAGSMLPKVMAAISFAESAPGRFALITSLEKAKAGLEGKTGTLIKA